MPKIILRSCLLILGAAISVPASADDDTERLIAAMLGDSVVAADLQELTDTIGGRVTGTTANRNAVAWAVDKLRQAEVAVTTEDFQMPAIWDETYVAAAIAGDTRCVRPLKP